MINLFDFTYCGDYNRQIQNLARMVPEKWSFSDTDDNGILKGYLEHTFKRLYEEQKVWEKKNSGISFSEAVASFTPHVSADTGVMIGICSMLSF